MLPRVAFSLLFAGVVCFGAVAAGASPPNVVFVLADDLGWNDVGFHNPEIRTPHLDRLAREGVELEAHYAQPQCTPSRVALLTGRYPSRFGTHCLVASTKQAFPVGTPTMATLFKRHGYATALIGKWHLGSEPAWGPNHHGFDHSYGALSGALGAYDHRYRVGTPYEKTWHRNLAYVEEEGHVMDLLAREAVAWIEAHKGAPFFLYLPFTAPHTPIIPKEAWLAVNAHIGDEERRSFAAVVSHLDDCVGQVVRALESAGLRERTLLVFTSDNGAQVNHKGDAYPGGDPAMTDFSSNAPLRGQKTTAYEGGVRVPTLVSWPGTLSPRKVSTPVHLVDWLPTFAALIGDKEADALSDGVDLLPLLKGVAAAPGERAIYTVWGVARQWEALRLGDWKIVRNRGKQGADAAWELYNLATDPNETTDLAGKEPARLEALVARFARERGRDASER